MTRSLTAYRRPSCSRRHRGERSSDVSRDRLEATCEADIPNDSMGASVRGGPYLLRFTPERLPAYATSNLRCTSCHQQDGMRATSGPLTGSHARIPKYMSRSGTVIVLADRVNCCHTRSLSGNAAFPPLWGPKSYSVGASMARIERAASFIRHNMPQSAPGSLTAQEAFDLSAFINSHPRPDSPGKQNDWPMGGAPADVPYETKGHQAFRPPQYLPRSNPKGAIVPNPPRISHAKS